MTRVLGDDQYNTIVADTKAKNLYPTFGSDFHNKDGIHPYIGLTGEDVKLTSQQIDEILENISE